jgi:hypothetical protein
LYDFKLLTKVITKSQLKALKIVDLRFGERSLCSMLKILAKGIASMRQLDEPHLEFIYCDGRDNETTEALAASEEALSKLVLSAARSPSLKKLYLALRSYPKSLDHALAACVRHSPSLQKIVIRCPHKRWLARGLPCIHDSPALIEALQTSCSSRRVRLEADIPHGPLKDERFLPLQRSLAVPCRLNMSGRAYMLTDPANQINGFKVLERVNNDLECLYFHLHENPIIVSRQGSLLKQSGRKRKGKGMRRQATMTMQRKRSR